MSMLQFQVFQGITLFLFPCKAEGEAVFWGGLQVLLRTMEGLSLSDFEREIGTKIEGTCVTEEQEEAQTLANDTHNAPPSAKEVLQVEETIA